MKAALGKSGMSVSDVDLFELNEAFAVVALKSARDLGVDLDRVNVDGGAISMGHPIGMSGARLVVHLVHELRAPRRRCRCGGPVRRRRPGRRPARPRRRLSRPPRRVPRR